MPVSIVVCAYTEERWNDLVAAVESLKSQTEPAQEIVIVVDHNVILLERVQRLIHGVVAVENRFSQGLSGARNTGIATATQPIIAFLDDDAVAEPEWLQRLCRHFDNPRILGVGGAVIPRWVGEQPRWFPEEFYWVVGCSYRGLPTTLAEVRNPFGGCMCVRRRIFDEVGGFQSGIGRVGGVLLGCEETEFAIRARQHFTDGIFLYDPSARIHHRIPMNRGSWRFFRSRCFGEGLSKAIVSRTVGARDALASEKSHVMRVLPSGFIRGFTDFVSGDWIGPLRSVAIGSGLAVTATGYLRGTINHKFQTVRRSAHMARGQES